MSDHHPDKGADPIRNVGQGAAKPVTPASKDRAARQAEELRRNLQRRKAQQRERQVPSD